MSPVRDATLRGLPEYELWVIRDVRLPQQGHEFILEGMFCVMFLLVLDVVPYSIGIRRTHAERAGALLPCKIETMLSKPARGICF
jgi:hypothetical protein